MTQGVLQLVDLGADGGGGKHELRARAGQAPFPGHVPEVQQVVVVQPFHDARLVRFFHTFNSIFSICRTIADGATLIVPVHGGGAG